MADRCADITELNGTMRDYLEFEKPIREIEEKIEKLLRRSPRKSSVQSDIRKLRAKLAQTEHELYKNLTPGNERSWRAIRNVQAH